MVRTVFFDLIASITLGIYAYSIWTGQWAAVVVFGLVAWLAVKLWIEEQEARP